MTANAMIGKRILVGLTYLNEDGDVHEQVQLHGLISQVGDRMLAFEKSDGSGVFSIPFAGQLEVADFDGVYTLRSTGEAVTGVSYVASFAIHPPVDH